MGEYGLATRVLAGRFGSMWTYAGGLAGRRPADARPRCSTTTASARSTNATDVYGLVGAPVAHSVSPAMHNAAFRAARARAVYLPLPAVDADDFVRVRPRARRSTAPASRFRSRWRCSSVSTRCMRSRAASARSTRFASTDGRWIGGNTDVERIPAAAAGPRAAARTARVGARRGRRGARGRGGAGVERRARHAPRAQSRSRPKTSRC